MLGLDKPEDLQALGLPDEVWVLELVVDIAIDVLKDPINIPTLNPKFCRVHLKVSNLKLLKSKDKFSFTLFLHYIN